MDDDTTARARARTVAEIVDAVLGREAGDPLPGTIDALRRATAAEGDAAAAALDRLLADPFARPLAVGVLADRPVEALVADAGDAEVDAGHLLALLAALGGPHQAMMVLARVGPPEVQRHVLEHVLDDWGADALPLAQAVADGHPEASVARAARKALFARL